MQQSLNPPAENKCEKRFGDWVFREGDRVMQVRNNYEMCIRDSYQLAASSGIRVTDGQEVEQGFQLNEGSLNPHDILRVRDPRAVHDYEIKEVQKVYRQQGVDINDKHIEVIVRQMMRKVRVEDAGDAEVLPGSVMDLLEFEDYNQKVQDLSLIHI